MLIPIFIEVYSFLAEGQVILHCKYLDPTITEYESWEDISDPGLCIECHPSKSC